MNIEDANQRGYRHKNLLFWLGVLRCLVRPIQPTDRVIDIGCGHGLFLQLLHEEHPFREGIGTERDAKSLAIARTRLAERRPNWPIRYLASDEVDKIIKPGSLDVAFCHEIFWMNADLDSLVQQIHRLLRPGGCGYATMGGHVHNPLWEWRKKRLLRDGMSPSDWSIDDVAETFSKHGFSIGVRRLPVDGFMMFHPGQTPAAARSLYDLVQTTSEMKFLFYFEKGGEVAPTTSLQG